MFVEVYCHCGDTDKEDREQNEDSVSIEKLELHVEYKMSRIIRENVEAKLLGKALLMFCVN